MNIAIVCDCVLSFLMWPAKCSKDLAEVPDHVIAQLEIIPVNTLEEAIKNAFASEDVPENLEVLLAPRL